MVAFDFPSSPIPGQIYAPAGGPIYTFQPPVWLLRSMLPISRVQSKLILVSETYVKPAGLLYLYAIAIGGGGGSAGLQATLANQSNGASGGGGASMIVKLYDGTVFPDSVAATIGSGGAAGPGGGAGGDGGTTLFHDLIAGGGGGGQATGAGGTFTVAGSGAGGVGSGGNILNQNGGRGEYGARCIHLSTDNAYGGGGGGNSMTPFRVGKISQGLWLGENGVTPGGGALGGATGQGFGAQAGRTGGAGRIFLWEYY